MATGRSPEEIDNLARTASRLRLEAAVIGVYEGFRAGGVSALLLKGASIAQWLYPDGGRRLSLDCDLLIAPGDVPAGEEVLASLGYGRHFDDRSMPSWWREHASAWVRDDDGFTIDLHRTLQGVGVDDKTAWRVLSRDQTVILIAGREIPALGLPARAFNIALHAAHHGIGWDLPIADLEHALEQEDDQLWRDAAGIAQELNAVEAFAAGLRLTEPGRRLASRLELPRATSVKAALHASTSPPIALGFEQLARARGVLGRLRIIWHKLVPPPDFICHWDPGARESRVALLRAYLRRPVWLARHAPAGFRAWREASRSVRSSKR